MEKVCRKLRFENRWTVSEPYGRKGGMLAAWIDRVEVLQVSQESHGFKKVTRILNSFMLQLLK